MQHMLGSTDEEEEEALGEEEEEGEGQGEQLGETEEGHGDGGGEGEGEGEGGDAVPAAAPAAAKTSPPSSPSSRRTRRSRAAGKHTRRHTVQIGSSSRRMVASARAGGHKEAGGVPSESSQRHAVTLRARNSPHPLNREKTVPNFQRRNHNRRALDGSRSRLYAIADAAGKDACFVRGLRSLLRPGRGRRGNSSARRAVADVKRARKGESEALVRRVFWRQEREKRHVYRPL